MNRRLFIMAFAGLMFAATAAAAQLAETKWYQGTCNRCGWQTSKSSVKRYAPIPCPKDKCGGSVTYVECPPPG